MKLFDSRKKRDGTKTNKHLKKAGILSLSLFIAAAYTPVSFAANIGTGVKPTYDEAYYATLDYYGNITQGSVVKSYTLNGFSTITDYGTYDEIINLTDDTVPETVNGKTVFNFDKNNPPKHFYFEGKTTEPFNSLPWSVSVSYELNGVPTEAQELPGKTGVVDINLDIIPNFNAGEYSRNNYTLEIMTAFNQDDILSLKAEGGQIQLLGNIRAVLFAVLPGEEQHFTISVGADSFTFSGLTFLMAPAKLAQLGMLSDLKADKQELEDSYHEISGSIDTLLDSISAMTGSLNSAAAGLDELNGSLQIISDGANEIYNSGDKALESLESFKQSLEGYNSHIDTADTVIDRVDESLGNVKSSTESLQKNLSSIKKNLSAIEKDMDNLEAITGTGKKSGNLQKSLRSLGKDLDRLKSNLNISTDDLAALQIGVGGKEVTIQGQTISQIQENFNTLENAYRTAGSGASLSQEDFITAVLIMEKGLDASTARATAQSLVSLSSLTEEQVQQMAEQYIAAGDVASAKQLISNYTTAVQLITVYNTATGGSTMNFKNFMWASSFLNTYNSTGDTAAAKKAADNSLKLYEMTQNGLLNNLASLCDTMGSDGLTEDLTDLTGVLGDTAVDMSDTLSVSGTMITTINQLIDDADGLYDIWKDNVPELKSTLTSTRTMLNSTTNLLEDTSTFLMKFQNLAKKAEPALNSGAKNSLSSLANVLRKAAVSTSSVSSVKNAKDKISNLIEKKWNEYTGEKNNILNMDPNAETESLTSSNNDTPQTIQILMRTQEITEDTAAKEAAEKAAADKGNIFTRTGKMFSDIWKAITNF